LTDPEVDMILKYTGTEEDLDGNIKYEGECVSLNDYGRCRLLFNGEHYCGQVSLLVSTVHSQYELFARVKLVRVERSQSLVQAQTDTCNEIP